MYLLASLKSVLIYRFHYLKCHLRIGGEALQWRLLLLVILEPITPPLDRKDFRRGHLFYVRNHSASAFQYRRR